MKKLFPIVIFVMVVAFAVTKMMIATTRATSIPDGFAHPINEVTELSAFTRQARLGLTPNVSGFGDQVSISGDTAAVFSRAGIYVLVRSGEAWSQQAVLIPSDGASVINLSATVSAIDADTIVVGGPNANINSNANQGAAYVFVRSGTTWIEQQRITASDGAAGDRFGGSTAISGDTIIVGAGRDDVGGNTDQGSAYIFVRQGATWIEQAKLLATDGAANNIFGTVVNISHDSAVISRERNSSAAVVDPATYVFARTGTTWSQQQRLSICEPSAFGCNFGNSPSLDGDRLAVGNSNLDVGANNAQGGVYVFTRSNGSWLLEQTIKANDGQTDDGFGSMLVLKENTIVVSSPAFNVRLGAAYVFTRSNSMWSQEQKIQEASPNLSNIFGSGLSMSGNTFIVGVVRDMGMPGPNQIGAAYIYTNPDLLPTPTPTPTITPTPTPSPLPTPSTVSVSGRVTTPGGAGLRNAVVSLVDSVGLRRLATTSSFGLYSFQNVAPNETYIISVSSKRYRFTPRTQLITGNVTDADFVGLE